MAILQALVAAVQFLTVVPLRLGRDLTEADYANGVAFYPLVGLGIGGALVGVAALAQGRLPGSVPAVLLLTVWVLAAGALHLDGFLDACDGLFGGHTPESRLRILRDERVGAFAVAGGVLLLLWKYALLAALAAPSPALWLAPTLGRWAMALAVAAFPYARPQGLGRALKQQVGWTHLVAASLVALAAGWGVAGTRGLAALASAGIVTLLVGRFAARRLGGGLTGDIYGAACEIVEALTLLWFVVEVAR